MPEDSGKKGIIAESISKILKDKKINLDANEVLKRIEIPPSPDLGDFALPCFFLASMLKEDPKDISLEIREEIGNLKGFKDIQTQGPYINFFWTRKKLSENLVSEILSKRDDFGKSNIGKGRDGDERIFSGKYT